VNVALCIIQIHLPAVGSLKEKRQVLRSLKDSLRGHYNVSVAEIDHQDLWQRLTLGSSESRRPECPGADFLVDPGEVERKVPGEVLSCEIEFLT